MNRRDNFFYSLQGYKISDSHFKLGSKIHISDFYYAKRMFYNSFFANRFAFFIASYILNNQLKNNALRPFTLIGYSYYSELMVSNTRRLLSQFLGNNIVNHDIILEDGNLLKNANKINSDIIVIVPISSTFSTSQKIIRDLTRIRKSAKFSVLAPYINILLVAPHGFENFKENGELVDNKSKNHALLSSFGWSDIVKENKEISISQTKPSVPYSELKFDYNPQVTIQKYFLPLYTNWERIYDCSLCFPKKARERCLLETERNSVTPNQIFGFPLIRENQNTNRSLYSDLSKGDGLIIRKHLKNYDNNYIYYIKTGAFLKENRKAIEPWLKESPEFEKLRKISFEGKNVTLLTPSKCGNSGFANLVNEFVFSDTATVLQYSASEDNIFNFSKFHFQLLSKSNVIVFIDDIILTARTFYHINSYVNSTLRHQNGKINYCVSLINRLEYFEEENLIANLIPYNRSNENVSNRFIFYQKFNPPTLMDKNFEFPYITLYKQYQKLSKESVLDIMRIHFKNRYNNFKPVDITHNREFPIGETKHLFIALLHHEFYKIFEVNHATSNKHDYKNIHILELINNREYERAMMKIKEFLLREESSLFEFLQKNNEYRNEIENGVIKVCSIPPLINYKGIKEANFEWILNRLENITKRIKENRFTSFFLCKMKVGEGSSAKEYPTKYCEFQTFKFLLKRAAKLKSNYIFSIEILDAIKHLLPHLGISKIRIYENDHSYDLFQVSLKVKSSIPISTSEFITYYLGLIQKMIIEDEAKAIELVMQVLRYTNSEVKKEGEKTLDLRNEFNDQFLYLLRLLVLENTFIFNSFFLSFIRDNKLIDYTFDNTITSSENEMFIHFKNDLRNYKDNYRFDALFRMLSKYDINLGGEIIRNEDIELEDAFYKTMYLKTLLQNEIKKSGIDGKVEIKRKVEILLKFLAEILAINTETSENQGGAFLTIRYRNTGIKKEVNSDDLYLVENFVTAHKHKLDKNVIDKKSILYEVYKGICDVESNTPRTTFEALYNKDTWQFRKNASFNSIGSFIETNQDKLYKNLFFLRISEIEIDEDFDSKETKYISNPQAVICFYKNRLYKKPNEVSEVKRLDPKRIRFILLLRDDIRKFIDYHLANDSLRALVEEENKIRFNRAITHGFDTYQVLLNAFSEKITEETVRNEFKNLSLLLLNKQRLIKFIADFENTKNLDAALGDNEIFKQEFPFEYIESLFTDLSPFVFSSYHPKHNTIEKSCISLTFKNNCKDKMIVCYDLILKEIVFEVLFNIRKRYNRYFPLYLNDANKLEIHIEIIELNKIYYLQIINNNCDLVSTPDQIQKLNFKDRNIKKGLNLINTISEIINESACIVNYIKGENKFELLIPIKFNGHEE